MGNWTFLTNHAHALVCIARSPGMRLRDVAECLDITERATHRIVSDLVEEGCLTRHRMGRRNYYEIDPAAPLRHPLYAGHEIGDLLAVLQEERRPAA